MYEADAAADARGQAGRRQGAAALGGHQPAPDGDTGRAIPTHASFFSGVGGLDLGLERAGWRTVSFSEIDPYASAVLAQRWPGVPNLGDITKLTQSVGQQGHPRSRPDRRGAHTRPDTWTTWHGSVLWSGGFPCQDLSIAGKRAGLAGERSGLAFAFLDLVAVHRPRLVLLENVPGLLSSHGGRDMAALLGALVELGYGVAYRVLDARHFGVPQRRRRVFIVGVRSGPDDADGHLAALRAAEVLAVGTRCRRHPPTGIEAGEEPAAGVRAGVDIARAVTGTSWKRHDEDTDTLIVGASPDPSGNGAPDGLAGRLDDRGGVAFVEVIRSGARDTDGNLPPEVWREEPVNPTLNGFEGGGARATTLVATGPADDDPLLPLGLDSHRYRCCGNGCAAPVAEWLGHRLMEAA